MPRLPMEKSFDEPNYLLRNISQRKRLEQLLEHVSEEVQAAKEDLARQNEESHARQLGANGYLTKVPNPADWRKRANAIKEFWLINNTLPLGCHQALVQKGPPI